MSDDKQQLVTINIDGQDVKVPAGMNVIEAAASINKEIPHYCYHPKLTISGNCRMCMIEMGMPMRDRATGEAILDDEGNPKIGWMPKPAIGCATNAAEGMHIKTNSENVQDMQEGVMEMLLVNHPLDCPICDQAGECRLQEFATDYGRGYSRFVEEKNVKPKRTVLGPRVTLDDERCILCSRCIRFSKEIAKDDVLGFTDRGSYSTLTCYPGKELANNYSLNTVDICPVGALTSTDFRFKMRVWFLKQSKSICPESSVGANTVVWSREGVIHRITPRRNDAVNDTWMADSGRELYKAVEAENRLKHPKTDGNKVSGLVAYKRISELLPTGKTAYVVSGRMSVEEQYLFKRLASLQPGEIYGLSHVVKEGGDGLLISADRAPNVRGALVTGLLNSLPEYELSDLSAAINSGEVKNLVVYNEDLTPRGVSAEQLKKVNLIYFGTHENATSEAAKVAVPTLTTFEKSGSYINQQFRVQKFEQAVPGPAGVMPDIISLDHVIAILTEQTKEHSVSAASLWTQMADELNEFKGMTFDGIPEDGIEINCSKYADLPYAEGPSLHYMEEALAEA